MTTVSLLALRPTFVQISAQSVLLQETGFVDVVQRQLVGSADASAESRVLESLELGDAFFERGEYADAVAAYRRAIADIEAQAELSPLLKAEALFGLGSAYRYLEEYDLALAPLEQALALVEALDEDYQASQDLSTARYADLLIALFRELGVVHNERAELGESLGYYQRGLVERDSPAFRVEMQAILLHNVGVSEEELGVEGAGETLKRAAVLSREAGRVDVEASAIFNLGWVAENAGDAEGAIARYQEAIALFQTTNTPDRLIRAYSNLAQVYIESQEYDRAGDLLGQAYDLLDSQGDAYPQERAYLLNRSGQLAQVSADSEFAWQNYRRALSLTEEIDDFGPVQALLGLGSLLEEEGRPDLAIFFYKRAVSRIEAVRKDIQKLSTDFQRSHTRTVEGEYRYLADLLLQQNRKVEALEVLELLKIQEVTAYLNGRLDEQNSLESSFYTLDEIEMQQRFRDLSEDATLADFTRAIEETDEPAVSLFDSKVVDDLRDAISSQPVLTAALYPVVLDNRLEILLISPDGTIEQFSSAVTREEIGTVVSSFQAALKDDILSPTSDAQLLYEWIVEPLEPFLEEQRVENIIYLPDSVLRYVPLAAFHTGDRWLAEDYQSHNVTAATVGDLLVERSGNLNVLAGAFADTSLTYQVDVGDSPLSYSGLRAARQELENLTKVAQTRTLFDRDFTPEDTLAAVGDRNILHLATHAQFVVGQPEESFILFGSGQTVNLKELRQWELPGVELVVLSACQTATSTEGEGKEILGLGYQVQQTGAGAAIASLWTVNDTATAALMNQFYIALAEGETKAQALRSAQRAMMENDVFAHPYHWAGFILIGNGL